MTTTPTFTQLLETYVKRAGTIASNTSDEVSALFLDFTADLLDYLKSSEVTKGYFATKAEQSKA